MDISEPADSPAPGGGSLAVRANELLATLGSTPGAVLEALLPVLLSPTLRALALGRWLRDRLPASAAIDLDVPTRGRLRLLAPDGEVTVVRLSDAVRAFLAGQ